MKQQKKTNTNVTAANVFFFGSPQPSFLYCRKIFLLLPTIEKANISIINDECRQMKYFLKEAENEKKKLKHKCTTQSVYKKSIE